MGLAEDSLYLTHALDNLVYGLKQLKTVSGKSIARVIQKNADPLPDVYPFIIFLPGGAQTGRVTRELDVYDEQVYTIVVRYVIGQVGQKYAGVQFEELWQAQPLILNYINSHPDLVFTDTQAVDMGKLSAHIPELQPDGVKAEGISKLGIIRDDPEHLGMEYAVTLPFHVELPDIYFGE